MARFRIICTVLGILVLGLWNSGCGGGSPADPGVSVTDSPERVLAAFADACKVGDVDTACELLVNPARWRHSMENAREMLPFYGTCLRDAEETRRERDCYRYRVRMRHPDDPQHRMIESKIYVRRVRGINGQVGRWGIDFINPGDGQKEIERKRHRMNQAMSTDPLRSGQWGTLATHASILTQAIVAYYVATYPEDVEFTGENGLLNTGNNLYDILVEHPGPIDTILGFDYDNYESMPPDAQISPNAVIGLLQAGTADEDVFVGELNGDGSINFLRDVVLTYDGEFIFQTTNGFGDDDDTMFKGFGHFLTPVNQNNYQTQFAEFDDADLIGGTNGAAVSSVDWALGMDKLGPFDLLGLVSLRESRNRKTFQRAIELMYDLRPSGHSVGAIENTANAFYTLGYSLHLLEDCGTPAHVRNDMHGVPYISSIPGFGGLQPDPLEDWGETLTSSFVNKTNQMLTNLINENNPIQRTEVGFPSNAILQNLYTNADHTDYPALEALFEYTAYTSNRQCFSEDTIYVSTNSSAAVTESYPYLTDLDLDFFGKSVVYGKPGSIISNDEYIAAVGNGMFDVWRSWFWATHWFSDPDVNDVIDALEGGWDILTVADEDDEDYFSNSVKGVREKQWELVFPYVVKSGAAYLHEFYLETEAYQ